MINHPERLNYNISSLKNAVFGGSTVSKDLLIKMLEMKMKNVMVGYGIFEFKISKPLTTA